MPWWPHGGNVHLSLPGDLVEGDEDALGFDADDLRPSAAGQGSVRCSFPPAQPLPGSPARDHAQSPAQGPQGQAEFLLPASAVAGPRAAAGRDSGPGQAWLWRQYGSWASSLLCGRPLSGPCGRTII